MGIFFAKYFQEEWEIWKMGMKYHYPVDELKALVLQVRKAAQARDKLRDFHREQERQWDLLPEEERERQWQKILASLKKANLL